MKNRECNHHTNLVSYAGELAFYDSKKPNSAEMGFLKHGFGHQTALDELYQRL